MAPYGGVFLEQSGGLGSTDQRQAETRRPSAFTDRSVPHQDDAWRLIASRPRLGDVEHGVVREAKLRDDDLDVAARSQGEISP